MTLHGQRALVLGATGHLGHAIVRELLAAGVRVTALTRQSRSDAFVGLDVDVVRGDLEQPGLLRACVPGHDIVVDAAAPYPLHAFEDWTRGRDRALDGARRHVERLLDAVAREGSVLGFVSSSATLPPCEGAGVLESMESRARRSSHPYFAAKLAMERAVLAAAGEGVRAVVINPTACLGPWDRKPRELCPVALLASGALPALADAMVNVVDVRDVSIAMRIALSRPQMHGRPIALAGHDCRTTALAARVCALAGARPPRLRMSLRWVAAAALSAEAVGAALGVRPSMHALGPLLVLDTGPRAPSEDQRAMGVAPRALDVTLRDALAWYRSIGYC